MPTVNPNQDQIDLLQLQIEDFQASTSATLAAMDRQKVLRQKQSDIRVTQLLAQIDKLLDNPPTKDGR